ncbi:MAG: phosphoribosylformylglycinamidine cyclo-ligase, partial [Cyclonatronaceae bacterium]
MSKKLTYKSAGVDVDAGNRFVKSIGRLVSDTHRPEVLTGIGGFGGLFQTDFSELEKPVLVSSVDGVGTKLIVAFRAGIYNTVGQDLVNHCVNDIAVCGADPLFFLDYFSTGKLKQEVAYDVVEGFSIACRENGCALIGGETAEMPDIYAEGEFDLAGTVVGVVDRSNILDGSEIREGDVVLGISGNGLHTNGYSLARKVLFSRFGVDEYIPELGMTIGEALLQIHPSYLSVIRRFRSDGGVRGFAHVTGGGIEGNARRILPDGFRLDLDWKSWEWPALFQLIRKEGQIPVKD